MATQFLVPAQKVRKTTVVAGNETFTANAEPNYLKVTGLASGTTALLIITGPDDVDVTLTVYIGYELRLTKIKAVKGSTAGSTVGVIYETLWIG